MDNTLMDILKLQRCGLVSEQLSRGAVELLKRYDGKSRDAVRKYLLLIDPVYQTTLAVAKEKVDCVVKGDFPGEMLRDAISTGGTYTMAGPDDGEEKGVYTCVIDGQALIISPESKRMIPVFKSTEGRAFYNYKSDTLWYNSEDGISEIRFGDQVLLSSLSKYRRIFWSKSTALIQDYLSGNVAAVPYEKNMAAVVCRESDVYRWNYHDVAVSMSDGTHIDMVEKRRSVLTAALLGWDNFPSLKIIIPRLRVLEGIHNNGSVETERVLNFLITYCENEDSDDHSIPESLINLFKRVRNIPYDTVLSGVLNLCYEIRAEWRERSRIDGDFPLNILLHSVIGSLPGEDPERLITEYAGKEILLPVKENFDILNKQ